MINVYSDSLNKRLASLRQNLSGNASSIDTNFDVNTGVDAGIDPLASLPKVSANAGNPSNTMSLIKNLGMQEIEMLKAKKEKEQNSQIDIAKQFGDKAGQFTEGIKNAAGQAGEQIKGAIDKSGKWINGKFQMTQGYGAYNPKLYKGGTHPGVDIGTPSGTKLNAPIAGNVEYGNDKTWGNFVKIKADDGTEIRFSHLSNVDDLLKQIANAKKRIEAGMILGLTGSTGYSTGPHLDISATRNGQFVNPMQLEFLNNYFKG